MKQIVIFDLDGTLLNTIGDLAASCNYVLKRYDLPEHTYEEYTSYVGNGIMRLVERAIPESLRTEAFVAKVRADFVEYYTENIDKHTVPYEGISNLLRTLQHMEIDIAVASNKFQVGTRKLIERFFPDIKFTAILGQRPGIPLKPNPQIVHDALNLSGYSASKALYIGDSGIDMATAAAAGVKSVGVTWGFRSEEELISSGAKYIVHKPADILKYLD